MSNLVNRIDARYIAGIGTLMAAVALFGFSRLTVPDSDTDVLSAVLSGQHLGADVNYWTQILPFVVLMALGMGAVFVPLTLTAVHHVRAEDSGIGSGVLNTMQQVGGALGLAILSTVASHYTTAHIDEDRARRRPGPPAGRPGRAGAADEQLRRRLRPGAGRPGRLPRLVHRGRHRGVPGRRRS